MLKLGTITGAVIVGALSSLFLKAKQTPRRAAAAVQRRTRKAAAHVKKSPARKK
jgi:DNA-binding XRE family transcriptional regulator